jgi:hypothetical protein
MLDAIFNFIFTGRLAHFPQYLVHKGQNMVDVCEKLEGYQEAFFENTL